MQVDYVDFDLNEAGGGLMSITCNNEHGLFYYLVSVIAKSGDGFDIKSSQILGCMNSDGDEVYAPHLSPRKIMVDTIGEMGVKKMLIDMYLHELCNQKNTAHYKTGNDYASTTK